MRSTAYRPHSRKAGEGRKVNCKPFALANTKTVFTELIKVPMK